MDTNLTYENARAGMVLDLNHTGIVIVHVINLGLYKILLTIDSDKYITIFTLGRKSKGIKCVHSYDIDGLYRKLLSYQ